MCCVAWKSLQASAFKQHQAEVAEVVKSGLWTSWAPKSVEIFNRIPPIFINGDSVGAWHVMTPPPAC